MATYIVRRATLADAATLLRHRIRMFEDMGTISSSDPLAARLSEEFHTWLEATMPAGTYVAWLVEDTDAAVDAPLESRLVAGGGATIIPWPPGPRHSGGRLAFVYNVYTEPAHRGLGLARRVMEAIHTFCRDERIGSVALNASEFGEPLYASMGYAVARSPMMFLSLDLGGL